MNALSEREVLTVAGARKSDIFAAKQCQIRNVGWRGVQDQGMGLHSATTVSEWPCFQLMSSSFNRKGAAWALFHTRWRYTRYFLMCTVVKDGLEIDKLRNSSTETHWWHKTMCRYIDKRNHRVQNWKCEGWQGSATICLLGCSAALDIESGTAAHKFLFSSNYFHPGVSAIAANVDNSGSLVRLRATDGRGCNSDGRAQMKLGWWRRDVNSDVPGAVTAWAQESESRHSSVGRAEVGRGRCGAGGGDSGMPEGQWRGR